MARASLLVRDTNKLCHPERSRGTLCFPRCQLTQSHSDQERWRERRCLCGTPTNSVIPSAVEGPCVSHDASSHNLTRTRSDGASVVACAGHQQTLSSRAQSRDLVFPTMPAHTISLGPGAMARASLLVRDTNKLCHPERSRGTLCFPRCQLTQSHSDQERWRERRCLCGTPTNSVIPSAVEGPCVSHDASSHNLTRTRSDGASVVACAGHQQTLSSRAQSRDLVFPTMPAHSISLGPGAMARASLLVRDTNKLCHPERSRGTLCFPRCQLTQSHSDQERWRERRCLCGTPTNSVIPSAVEGPCVSHDASSHNLTRTRSDGASVVACAGHQQTLSSRAQPRDLVFPTMPAHSISLGPGAMARASLLVRDTNKLCHPERSRLYFE